MTARGDSKDFGRYLQTCRRAGGMSLAIVSHQTKITLENLRLIENEQLEHLPDPVFVKGFIKAFAGAVGADPEEALVRLDNKLGVDLQSHAGRAEANVAASRWWHMVLATVLFAAQIWATLSLASWMNSPRAETSLPVAEVAEVTEVTAVAEVAAVAEDPVSAESVIETEPESDIKTHPVLETPNVHEATESASQQPDLATEQQKKVEPPATPPAGILELRMTAVEATWLKVVSDDNEAREFLLQQDQDVTITAERKFKIVIGNASGIRLMLNDQPVPVSGKSGQVVALHLP